MISLFDNLRDMSFASVFLKMMLSLVCGGIIGIEREYKRRSAGFRTHILICVGACMTTLTGQYLTLFMHYTTDMARLGAQVIAGIGFIGAGAIIRTPRRQVRGLTTSAGLWAVAITGLTFGAGFYEGGLIATALIFIVESVLSKFEYNIKYLSKDRTIYIEYRNKKTLDKIFEIFDTNMIKIDHIEIAKLAKYDANNEQYRCAIITIQPNHVDLIDELLEQIEQVDDVDLVDLLLSR